MKLKSPLTLLPRSTYPNNNSKKFVSKFVNDKDYCNLYVTQCILNLFIILAKKVLKTNNIAAEQLSY